MAYISIYFSDNFNSDLPYSGTRGSGSWCSRNQMHFKWSQNGRIFEIQDPDHEVLLFDHSNRRGFQVPIEFSPKFMKFIKGFPVGKVGPCLHLGGLASFNLAKIPYFHRIKTDSVLKMQIIMIGSAVGLACAFGTPIAGIFLIKNKGNQMILKV